MTSPSKMPLLARATYFVIFLYLAGFSGRRIVKDYYLSQATLQTDGVVTVVHPGTLWNRGRGWVEYEYLPLSSTAGQVFTGRVSNREMIHQFARLDDKLPVRYAAAHPQYSEYAGAHYLFSSVLVDLIAAVATLLFLYVAVTGRRLGK